MVGKYALFDPSSPSSDGSFWSWRSPSLDRRMLDRLYYDTASKVRPEQPNQLGIDTIIGGFANVTTDWKLVFRYGNGGRDIHGRPGRFVMIVAGVPLETARSVDLASLLTCQQFEDTLRLAPSSCPVPAPDQLEVSVEEQSRSADPILVAQVIRDGRLDLEGPDSIEQAAAICNALPDEWLWACHVKQEGANQTASIQRLLAPQTVQPSTPSVVTETPSVIDDEPVPTVAVKPRRTGTSNWRRLVWVLSFAVAAVVFGQAVRLITTPEPNPANHDETQPTEVHGGNGNDKKPLQNIPEILKNQPSPPEKIIPYSENGKTPAAKEVPPAPLGQALPLKQSEHQHQLQWVLPAIIAVIALTLAIIIWRSPRRSK